MRLFYYRSQQGNFGDDLNAWLWEELLPGRWSDDSDVVFSGIGTIIGHSLPPARKVIVFTSGVGYSPIPADFHGGRWVTAAVRGPLSARTLGLPAEAAVADGALLLSTLPRLAPLAEGERHGTVFVPHHQALADDSGWHVAAEAAGVELLDPRLPSETVIGRLRSARRVIADSMHAAIIADSLRVPWIPVVSSSHISSFKWLDWAMSLEVPYEPVRLPAPSLKGRYASWAYRFYNHAHHVDPPGEERVMARFRRSMALDAKPWWPGLRRPIRRVLHAIPDRMSRHRPIGALAARIDRRRIDRTAQTLAALAERPGYLSDGRVLALRVEELQRRLAHIDRETG